MTLNLIRTVIALFVLFAAASAVWQGVLGFMPKHHVAFWMWGCAAIIYVLVFGDRRVR